MKKRIEDYPLILTATDLSEIMKVSKRKAHEVMDHPEFPLIRIGRAKGFFVKGFLNGWNSRHRKFDKKEKPLS